MDDLLLVWALQAVVVTAAAMAARFRIKGFLASPVVFGLALAMLDHRWGGVGPHNAVLREAAQALGGMLPVFVGFLAVTYFLGLWLPRWPAIAALIVAWGGYLTYLEAPLSKG